MMMFSLCKKLYKMELPYPKHMFHPCQKLYGWKEGVQALIYYC